MTGITLSVELITRMAEVSEYIRCIKLEDPPTGMKMQSLAKTVGPGSKVFGALGGMYALSFQKNPMTYSKIPYFFS